MLAGLGGLGDHRGVRGLAGLGGLGVTRGLEGTRGISRARRT